MHLSPEFGMTINEIEKDGFKIDDKIDTILSSDSGEAMAKSIGITLMGLTQSLDRIKPDRNSTRLNSSHANISYAVFCLKKKNTTSCPTTTIILNLLYYTVLT